MLNRIDSISLYHDVQLNTAIGHWNKSNNKSGKACYDNYYIRDGFVNLRYFPNFWGTSRLYINFSIPKLIQGNNTFSTNMQDIYIAVDKLRLILDKHVPSAGITNADIFQMNAARVDLFVMRQIPIGTKQDHLKAYSRLYLGNYHQYQHKSTSYLFSGKYDYSKRHSQSSVVRIYDKPKEMAHRLSLIDTATEDDFNWLLSNFDMQEDYIRLEFQLKRPKLKQLFKTKDITLLDVLDYNFQIDCINRYLERLKLHLPILTNAHFNQAVLGVFNKHGVQQRAVGLARSIYDGHKPQFQPKDSYVIGKLKKAGIHVITSDKFDLLSMLFIQ